MSFEHYGADQAQSDHNSRTNSYGKAAPDQKDQELGRLWTVTPYAQRSVAHRAWKTQTFPTLTTASTSDTIKGEPQNSESPKTVTMLKCSRR